MNLRSFNQTSYFVWGGKIFFVKIRRLEKVCRASGLNMLGMLWVFDGKRLEIL